MDVERIIAESEWLERVFAVPDTRPLSASDIAAANRRHDAFDSLRTSVSVPNADGKIARFALVIHTGTQCPDQSEC